MEPVTAVAADTRDLMERMIGTRKRSRVHWQSGDLLVLDNWSVLHARDRAAQTDPSRKLARILLI